MKYDTLNLLQNDDLEELKDVKASCNVHVVSDSSRAEWVTVTVSVCALRCNSGFCTVTVTQLSYHSCQEWGSRKRKKRKSKNWSQACVTQLLQLCGLTPGAVEVGAVRAVEAVAGPVTLL